MSEERKLATVERILSLHPIEGADQIEVAKVRGWDVVVRKGEFSTGDWVVYFELDSLLPLDDSRFAFLMPRGSRRIDGKDYHVLKTARLRGQYSQGLALPLRAFWKDLATIPEGEYEDPYPDEAGTDVTEWLGITKYDPEVPYELSGTVIGPFPTNVVKKTDSLRVQNLSDFTLASLFARGKWVATEKIDGSSVTFIKTDGKLRACSRNWELAQVEGSNASGVPTPWRLAERYHLADAIPEGGWVQGEMYGEKIQSNPYGVEGQCFAAFSWSDYVDLGLLSMAPAVYLEFPTSVEAAVGQVEGMTSLLAPGRQAEGVVWHEVNGQTFPELGDRNTFKVINNKYLLKKDR